MREIELIEKRGKREKHFLQENGEIIARVYNDDIHFLKNGKYEEIDNTLLKEGKCYVNKNNKYKVSFNEDIKDGLMNIELDNHYLKFILKDGKASLLKKKNDKSKLFKKINYENVFDNIDFEYDINPTKVKEGIVLKDKSAIKNKLCFDVLTDLTLTLLEDGSIDAEYEGTHVFKIDAPYMLDSNNVINKNVFYKLKDKNGQYELSLDLDQKWLNEPTTKYPVYVDPTISTNNTSGGVYDTYIYPGDTGVDRNSHGYLKIGVERKNNVDTINRALIKFDLPTIGTGSQVIYAGINLYEYPAPPGIIYDYSDLHKLTIHQVTSSWNENDAKWSTMHDKYKERVLNWIYGNRTNEDVLYPQECSITEIVKKWYADTPNYGIMIKDINETYQNDLVPAFFSKNHSLSNGDPKPFLVIHYRNQNGLENYMSYNKLLFNGGVHYINNYNGNLVAKFDIGKTIGGKFPAIVKLFYNTNDVVMQNDYGFGKGYKLNFHQTIKEVTIGDTLYLEYIDEDGTIHYFKDTKSIAELDTDGYMTENIISQENTFYDEDGLEMTITKQDQSFILRDKEGNMMVFNVVNGIGKLVKITDLSNNEIIISYTNDKITKITDANNSEILLTYDINKITIISPNKTIFMNYSNDLLYNIQTIYGTILIEYDSNKCISNITDLSNKKVNYEYYSQIPYRVRKITEYGLNDIEGASITYEYAFNATTIIDNKNRATTITFNNTGNVRSISDLKSKEDVDDAYGTDIYYNQYFQYTNKLTTAQTPMKYIKNILKDPSFELGTNDFKSSDDTIITSEVSTNCAHSGNKSLKITNTWRGEVYKTVRVLKGYSYTFSVYIKNDYELILSLGNASKRIYTNMEFTRYSITTYCPLDSEEDEYTNLTFGFYADNEGDVIYVDDMQLEVGEVANGYNYIENSDFSEGISDLNVTASDPDTGEIINNISALELVTLSNNKKALKIEMDPRYNISLSRSINISGKAGDLYNISFWYKNEGIECPEMSDGIGGVNNCVIVSFDYINADEGEHAFPSDPLNPNEEQWQYFNCNFQAVKDYSSINLNFFQNMNANNLYITNLSLFKDVRTVIYDYDENGNLRSSKELNESTKTYNYDNFNQLIGIKNAKGKNYVFEYDNLISNRILNGISPSGITNKIDYDSFGNTSETRITNNGAGHDVSNGLYSIRLKGNDKYIKLINNSVGISENDCCCDKWEFEKNNNYFKIKHYLLNNKYLCANNSLISNDNLDDSLLFELIRNNNGSYLIKSKNGNYLKYTDTSLEVCEFVEGDYHFEFYIEKDSNLFIENNNFYSSDGRFIEKNIDTNLNETTYTTNPVNGLVEKIINSKNTEINYSYNNKMQLIQRKKQDKIVNYEYNNQNVLSKIDTGYDVYDFNYDEFLNIKKISINNIPLITNNYAEKNGNLISSEYGNGNIVNFSYDELDRLSTMTKMNHIYKYSYDINGNIAKIVSDEAEVKYLYDLAKRLYKYIKNDFEIEYSYDENNNIVSKIFSLENYFITAGTHVINDIGYEWNEEERVIKTYCNGSEVSYNYDTLGRIINKNFDGVYSVDYKYITNGKRTSLLLSSIKNNNDEYRYKYDKLNNITHIYHNDKLISKYYYDMYNQVIREDNFITYETTKFNYDNFGNMLTKRVYMLNDYNLLRENKYEYNNTNWKAQLTKVNNQSITYDNIGNPLSIGDNITMSWKNGRELSTYIDNEKNISYDYNQNGLRTGKLVNNSYTQYYLENKKIIFEVNSENCLYFCYDENDGVIGFKRYLIDRHREEDYFFIKNAQYDIIGIIDSNHKLVAKYEYDCLGNIIYITDGDGNDVSNNSSHIANINPFRYRSYYYDNETNLYYLNNRYYNPVWGRFLNADRYLFDGNCINAGNMYIYCDNNFVNNYDVDGNFVKNLWNNLKKGYSKVKKTISDGFEKVKKGVTDFGKSVSEKVGNFIKGVKDNFVLESSTDSGFNIEAEILGVGVAVKDYNSASKDIKNGKNSCSLGNTQGITIGPFSYSKTTSDKVKCDETDDYNYDEEILVEKSFEIGPVDIVNDTIFIGIEIGIAFGIGAHIKIGWEIPY